MLTIDEIVYVATYKFGELSPETIFQKTNLRHYVCVPATLSDSVDLTTYDSACVPNMILEEKRYNLEFVAVNAQKKVIKALLAYAPEINTVYYNENVV